MSAEQGPFAPSLPTGSTSRILYLNEEGNIAGAEKCLLQLVERLPPDRFTPIVACPDGPLAGRLAEVGVAHVPYEFRRRKLKTGKPHVTQRRYPNPLALLQKIREGVQLQRFIRSQQIDLLHTNSLSAHIAGLVAARITGIPVIWHIHQFWPDLLYKLPQPDRLVFVSYAVQREAYGGSPPERAQVIYNGEDFSAYDPDADQYNNLRGELGIGHPSPIVATVGRLDPIKGLDDLLQAWQIVHAQRPSARLLIVGDELTVHGMSVGGSYRATLEELSRQLGVADVVIFTGWRQDIIDVLYTADIFVFASRGDTSGRSVIEAMAMKKPVVAVQAGGVPELLTHGESGLLVPPGDIPALAEAIIHLMDDRELREALGQAARDRVLMSFTIERHVAQIQALYDELLEQSG